MGEQEDFSNYVTKKNKYIGELKVFVEMKRKYLNLDVYQGVIRFENIEFRKDDTESYKRLFNYYIKFLNEVEVEAEILLDKKQVIIKLETLMAIAKSTAVFNDENNNLNDKLLYVFSTLLPLVNKYIEEEITLIVLLNSFNSVLNTEIIDIVDNYLNPQSKVFLFTFIGLNSSYEKESNIKLGKELEEYKKYYKDALVELKKYENATKNKTSVNVYAKIESDFKDLESKYRVYFFTFVVLTLLFTVGYNPLIGIWDNIVGLGCSLSINISDHCTALNNQVLYPFNGNTLKYIIFKVAILLVGITLSTYFLKLTSFYQLRQEQAKQTKLELEAFPDFVSGMDKDVANNLREELALKYFGKDVDKTQIDKNGDLIQEQMKISTDLVKASVDMFKNIKTVNTNDDANKSKVSTTTES